MSYSGFGIQSMNSFQKPRRVFKPIFEQLAIGEHPTETSERPNIRSWKEVKAHLRNRELRAKVVSTYVYLLFTISVLTGLLINAL